MPLSEIEHPPSPPDPTRGFREACTALAAQARELERDAERAHRDARRRLELLELVQDLLARARSWEELHAAVGQVRSRVEGELRFSRGAGAGERAGGSNGR